MKSLILIFVILILGIIVIVIFNKDPEKSTEEVIFKDIAWRQPIYKEKIKISNVFLLNEKLPCNQFYIKKFNNVIFLVACNRNGDGWEYYTLNIAKLQLDFAGLEVIATLSPPEIKRASNKKRILDSGVPVSPDYSGKPPTPEVLAK